MVYNPATDFLALWRNTGAALQAMQVPGLDYVIGALARAGVINVAVQATAPVANQSTTAWLQTAVPSSSAEGTFFLWNSITSAYTPASSDLFLDYLQACANESGVSWWTSTGGPPANTVGSNGDYAVRTDEPGGIYGPKALGAWPLVPVPGTADVLNSNTLDSTFGTAVGNMLYRGAAGWVSLPIGPTDNVLTVLAGVPAWDGLSALMDVLFTSVQGSILYRDAGAWQPLLPGVANTVLTTQGPGANPNWTAKASEFTSGTTMLFQQTAAPTGWTKQTAIDNYGLRVTAGTVGTTAGTPFSTVFSQSAVGNTTITQATSPSHSHTPSPALVITSGSGSGVGGGGAFGVTVSQSMSTIGSDGAHTHSINMSLAYTDVIIATKN